ATSTRCDNTPCGFQRRGRDAFNGSGCRSPEAPVSALPSSLASAVAFNTRVAFVTELARRLHQYGTAAPRLEEAVGSAALRLGLRADVFSSPTAIILSFADLARGEDSVAQ